MRRLLVMTLVAGLTVTTLSAPSGAATCGLTLQGQVYGSNGGFFGLIDAAIDEMGNVYVSAEANGQMHVFSTVGEYLRSFDAESPHGLAVQRGLLYSASWGASKVQVMTTTGEVLVDWSSWDEDGASMSFQLPLFIDVDPRGFIYVTDEGLGQVRKFTPDGQWVTTFGPDRSNGVAVQAGRIYVANANAQRVDVFTLSGAFLTSFGGPGDGDGEFFDPRGVAAAGGSVYVSDTDLRRVQAFSLNGVYRSQAAPPDVLRLDGVGADARGNVFVTDQFTNLLTFYRNRPGACS